MSRTLKDRIILIFLLITLMGTIAQAQTVISGQVTDKQGEAIPGANVYIDNSYDGITTDIEGHYQFESFEEGAQTLVISFIGYEQINQEVELTGEPLTFEVEMAEEINKLDGIVISAGAFEASDEKKGVVLKPLDIAMTAGATADIPGALNTLPGTQTNGESGRLFVRGGTDEETRVFIDGMLVHDFYNPSAPNTPGRSRFSPFLFKGTTFSTGGYSAEYGQALSSTLALNSIGLADETESNISLMTVGGEVGHTQRWEKSSLFGQLGYINLNPYNSLVDQAYDFEKGHTGLDGTLSYRHQTQNGGMVKVFGNFSLAGFEVNQPNVNDPATPNHTDLQNDYYFLNATYQDMINQKWSHRTGVSYTSSTEDIIFNENDIVDQVSGVHVKSVFDNDLSKRVSLRLGSELFLNEISRDWTNGFDSFDNEENDQLVAGFVEADVFLSSKFVLRPGVRAEYSSLINQENISPRLSLAFKTSDNAQISAAVGQFYQLPVKDQLLVTQDLGFEKANHYILNYQYMKEGRIFRIEGYHKDYQNLLTYSANDPFDPTMINNDGFGYAQGVDLFWRDNKTIKNVDYWVSYSFLDTKRQFRDYPQEAMPEFASNHNFSMVYKHFISPIRTQFGMTYSFTSGRPYHDPNREGFNQGRIPSYHDLSFNAAYLFKQNIIFYTSITNLTGQDNIFGYQYANSPNPLGQFDRLAIGQPAKRFYFLGVFITLTRDKQKNQLNNL